MGLEIGVTVGLNGGVETDIDSWLPPDVVMVTVDGTIVIYSE